MAPQKSRSASERQELHVILPDKIPVTIVPSSTAQSAKDEPRLPSRIVSDAIVMLWKDKGMWLILVLLAAGLIASFVWYWRSSVTSSGRSPQGVSYIVKYPRCLASFDPQVVSLDLYLPSSAAVPVTGTYTTTLSVDSNLAIFNDLPQKVMTAVPAARLSHVTTMRVDTWELNPTITLNAAVESSGSHSEAFALPAMPVCFYLIPELTQLPTNLVAGILPLLAALLGIPKIISKLGGK